MNVKQVKIFNEWIAPVTRSHIRDIISTFYKSTGWTNQFGSSALDIGCGDGSATAKVLKTFLPESTLLWATDNSSDMIDIANLKYENCGVNFVVSDVLDDEVQFRSRFDCVFSFYCLHNVTDQRKALRNIYNMLKPKGYCLLSALSQNNFYVAFEKLAITDRWSPYMADVERLRPVFHDLQDVESGYKNWLSESGFSEITVKKEKRKILYDTWQKFEGLMQFANPYYWNIPKSLRQEYMRDYKRELMKLGLVKEVYSQFGDFAGIEETYYNLVVYAKKI